jgi:hypothetical protein
MAENRNPAAAGDGASANGFPSGTTDAEVAHSLQPRPARAGTGISIGPSGRQFRWHRNGDHWHLTQPPRTAAVAAVVPDGTCPDMYRAQLPGEPLSDMVNLTRAKDAALHRASVALAKDHNSRAGGAPRARFPGQGLPKAGSATKRASEAVMRDPRDGGCTMRTKDHNRPAPMSKCLSGEFLNRMNRL